MNKAKQITLEHIITIEGKNGLFRIINPGKTTLIIETIDEVRKKMIIDGRQQVSVLDKISIYNNGTESKKDLIDVLLSVSKHYNKKPITDVHINNADELTAFMNKVMPTYDKQRVYASNIKKIVKWYNTIITYYPDLISKKENTTKPKPKVNAETKSSEEGTKSDQTSKSSDASVKKDKVKSVAKKNTSKAKEVKKSAKKDGKTLKKKTDKKN